MFQKMYVDEPDNWQPIEEAQAREELGRCYRNVDEVLDCMKHGGKARTPFAFYKWSLAVASGVKCAGEAIPFIDYFRRGLITADEWSRLESVNLPN